MTSTDRSCSAYSFETFESDSVLRYLDQSGFCVIRKMIDSLPNHLKRYADGYTGYDGAWRDAA